MINSKLTLYKERAIDVYEKMRLRFLPVPAAEQSRTRSRQKAFVTIEQERRWGDSHASGWGSTVDYTRTTQDIVVSVIGQYGLRSMIDVACGDFAWMPLVLERLPADFHYTGSDIVPALIERNAARHPQHEFKVIDFVADPLPARDLIFCRDALQHLPVGDILKALRNFSRSGAKYLLASTHLRRHGWRNARECRVGQCRDRNLLLAPFHLPDPIVVYSEKDPSHKFLGLWSLPFPEGE